MTKEEYIKMKGKDINAVANDIWREWQKQKLLGHRGKELPYNITEFKQLYKKVRNYLLNDPAGAKLVKIGRREYIISNKFYERYVHGYLSYQLDAGGKANNN